MKGNEPMMFQTFQNLSSVAMTVAVVTRHLTYRDYMLSIHIIHTNCFVAQASPYGKTVKNLRLSYELLESLLMALKPCNLTFKVVECPVADVSDFA